MGIPSEPGSNNPGRFSCSPDQNEHSGEGDRQEGDQEHFHGSFGLGKIDGNVREL